MVDLAENFGLAVVAEGIESESQRAQLVELGCQMGQGLHLSPPLPVEEADALLLSSGLFAPDTSTDPGAASPADDDAAREDLEAQ